MSLTDPKDRDVVEAAATDFLKICERHGVDPEQIAQVSIAVGSTAIELISGGDPAYRDILLERYIKSLTSIVKEDAKGEAHEKGTEEGRYGQEGKA